MREEEKRSDDIEEKKIRVSVAYCFGNPVVQPRQFSLFEFKETFFKLKLGWRGDEEGRK